MPEAKEQPKIPTMFDYRLERLIELGFSKYQAKKIANMRIGVSEVRETYLMKGCTPDLAWRILREV